MTDLMLLMEEVVLICVALVILLMYLFYVRYPLNKDWDSALVSFKR